MADERSIPESNCCFDEVVFESTFMLKPLELRLLSLLTTEPRPVLLHLILSELIELFESIVP